MSVATREPYHVLAVDDSLIDRKLIERLLKTSSYQVTTVDSGSKALELLGIQYEQTNPPSTFSHHHQEIEVNLVITDYCMPEMTGYDLLKKIKESSVLKDIPVVIMSSENVPSRINRCIEGGAEEFFLKPVQLSDLKRLRPYLLKRKVKDHHQQKQNNEELQHLQQQNQQINQEEKQLEQLHQQIQQEQKQVLQQQQNFQEQKQLQHQNQQEQEDESAELCSIISYNNNNNNNGSKRKSMEEVPLSPERTRPRFSTNSLTVL